LESKSAAEKIAAVAQRVTSRGPRMPREMPSGLSGGSVGGGSGGFEAAPIVDMSQLTQAAEQNQLEAGGLTGGLSRKRPREPQAAPQPWSEAETKLLLEMIVKDGGGAWEHKARQLGTGRSGKALQTRWLRVMKPGGAASAADLDAIAAADAAAGAGHGGPKKKSKLSPEELESAKRAKAEARQREEERRMEARLAIIQEKERKDQVARDARDYVEKVMEQRREADRVRQAAQDAARVQQYEEQQAAKNARREKAKEARNNRKGGSGAVSLKFLPSSAYDTSGATQHSMQGAPQMHSLGMQQSFQYHHAAPALPPGCNDGGSGAAPPGQPQQRPAQQAAVEAAKHAVHTQQTIQQRVQHPGAAVQQQQPLSDAERYTQQQNLMAQQLMAQQAQAQAQAQAQHQRQQHQDAHMSNVVRQQQEHQMQSAKIYSQQQQWQALCNQNGEWCYFNRSTNVCKWHGPAWIERPAPRQIEGAQTVMEYVRQCPHRGGVTVDTRHKSGPEVRPALSRNQDYIAASPPPCAIHCVTATMSERPPRAVQSVGASVAAWQHKEVLRQAEEEETTGLEKAVQRLRAAAQSGAAAAAAVLAPLRESARKSAELREATAKMSGVRTAPARAAAAPKPAPAPTPAPTAGAAAAPTAPAPAASSVAGGGGGGGGGGGAAVPTPVPAPAQRASTAGQEQLKALFRQQAAAAAMAASNAEARST
jgi:hypothetical protein